MSDLLPELRHLLTDPSVLLEQPGGPVGLKADLILEALYGLDEQVDTEWRILRVEPTLLRAISPRLTAMVSDDPIGPGLPTARYELQSAWATNEVTVALVRYRRVTA